MGVEYSFASGAGIFESEPKEAAGAKFRESIDLGAFEGGSSELRMAVAGRFAPPISYLQLSSLLSWIHTIQTMFCEPTTF